MGPKSLDEATNYVERKNFDFSFLVHHSGVPPPSIHHLGGGGGWILTSSCGVKVKSGAVVTSSWRQCECGLTLVDAALLLEETAVFEVLFDDDVGDGVEHELDVFRVCGAGHVGVDLLDVSAQVQVQELDFDVVSGVLVSVGAWRRSLQRGVEAAVKRAAFCGREGDLTVVFGEAHAEVGFLDFLHEHVLLVEEEYDGGGGEVAVVADAVEQVQTFVHPVLRSEGWGGGQ